jgi:hypothetical protein
VPATGGDHEGYTRGGGGLRHRSHSQGVVKGFISGSPGPKFLTRMNNLPCPQRCFNRPIRRRGEAPRGRVVRRHG